MERSDCCVVTPTRGTASGIASRWLLAAWRESAESGSPACVLVPRKGVLVVAWVNQALGALLGRDLADLAGHALSELVPDTDASTDLPAAFAAGVSAEGPDASLESSGEVAAEIGWARLVHLLARTTGGSGVARVDLPDGSAARARVRVVGIGATSVPVPATLAEAGAAVPVPAPRAGDPLVTRQGVVDPLPGPESPRAWLVRVDPVADAVADAEYALSVAEHRFEALAGTAPIGIFASEAGLRLGYVNDCFVRLVGRSAHALVGTGWLDALHPDDLPAVYSAVQSVLAGTPVEVAVRLAQMTDVQRWLQLRLAPTTTPARAAGFIGTAEDVTDRRSWEEHLTYQAHHDPLTGLVNRRRLLDVLKDLLQGRRGRDFAVLFLDLDGFKDINDTHGHEAGDRALVEVARRMQRVARETDVVARVAGDEFVVVLRHISSAGEAEAAARRHLRALAEPLRIAGAPVALSASVGVALPAGFDTPEALLRAADRLMYEAKAAGQGLYRLSPDSRAEV